MRRMLAWTIAVVALASAAAAQAPDKPVPCEQVASIGVATMAADGTITMRVRSLPPGPVAEGTFEYRPDNPRYQDILKHLGGLAPGESKPVPPWC